LTRVRKYAPPQVKARSFDSSPEQTLPHTEKGSYGRDRTRGKRTQEEDENRSGEGTGIDKLAQNASADPTSQGRTLDPTEALTAATTAQAAHARVRDRTARETSPPAKSTTLQHSIALFGESQGRQSLLRVWGQARTTQGPYPANKYSKMTTAVGKTGRRTRKAAVSRVRRRKTFCFYHKRKQRKKVREGKLIRKAD